MNQAQYGPSHATGLHGRMKSYAETLQKLNEADTNKQKISAVDAFASAAAAHPDGAALLLPCSPLTLISCGCLIASHGVIEQSSPLCP